MFFPFVGAAFVLDDDVRDERKRNEPERLMTELKATDRMFPPTQGNSWLLLAPGTRQQSDFTVL